MASITTQANGSRAIQFVGRDGKRKTIRLGKVPMRSAETIKLRVEHLIAATLGGGAIDPETARWLTTLDKRLADKFAKAGLIARREAALLEPYLVSYVAMRSDVKPRTRNNFEQAKGWLVDYFGANRRLSEITTGDADEFRLWLLGKVGDNTARRHCGRAKQFFRAAVRKRLIDANPFADMKGCCVKANKARDYFVTLEEANQVLDACPNTQWRLLFALSRFGGLRCPSEHLSLTWGDVDWETSRITVRSPKTEHHEGKEVRTIPIFPELRPHLKAAFDQANPGTEHVVTIPSIRRDRYGNVRTSMAKIIHRAGLTPWPKLFQNMRATRETELAQRYPIHVVCEWIGNSQGVALKHYLRVTDEDYNRAVSTPAAEVNAHTALHSVEQRAAKGAAPDARQALQTATQQPAAGASKSPQSSRKSLGIQSLEQVIADKREMLRDWGVPPAGFEPATC